MLHKVFISYHHANDQAYKDKLIQLNNLHELFIDRSVNTGDISDDLSDEAIRVKIRDEYLRDSTVTILLVGLETKTRKHVDWELFSSMYDGNINKKSGILVVCLPSTGCSNVHATHAYEKELIYPDIDNWTNASRIEYQRLYPYFSERIIDNLVNAEARISVTYWERIINDLDKFRLLISMVCEGRLDCKYDLRQSLRRKNS